MILLYLHKNLWSDKINVCWVMGLAKQIVVFYLKLSPRKVKWFVYVVEPEGGEVKI